LFAGLALLRPGVVQDLERVAAVDDLPHYVLDLSISDSLGTYRGRGTLTWTNTTGQVVSTLPLLLHPNGPGETGASSRASLSLDSVVGGTTVARRPSLVEVTLDAPLSPGESTTLELAFGGELQLLRADANDLWAQAGLGAGGLTESTDYGLLGEGDGLLTAASAYPMVAPWTGSGFATDAPTGIGDLAWGQPMHFDVQIVTPEGLRPVTNLVDGAPERVGQGSVTRASGSGVRDLVIVASRDWSVVERQVRGVTVRSWSLARDAEVGREVLDEAEQALASLDRRLVPYPYTELDVVEATLAGGAGGVEFSGLVLIAGFFYTDPSQSQSPMAAMMRQLGGSGSLDMSAFLEDQRAFVVAHEVAHQWSPGLVGTDSAHAPLVDEALAQYLAGTVMEEVRGEAAGRALSDKSVALNYAAFRLLGGADGPAARPVSAYASPLEYAALVYGKAPYLYRALEDQHGRAAVDRALKHSFESLAWREADVATWLGLLEVHGLPGAEALGQRWLHEAHGDEDLGIDPEGWRALELMVGQEMAEGLRPMLSMMGMTPAMLFGGLGGGVPAQLPMTPGTVPTPEELLELLGHR